MALWLPHGELTRVFEGLVYPAVGPPFHPSFLPSSGMVTTVDPGPLVARVARPHSLTPSGDLRVGAGFGGPLPVELPIEFVKSAKGVDFITAIAANGGEEQRTVAGLTHNKAMIRSVSVVSKEQRAWAVVFWRSSGFDDADMDVDSWIERTEFLESEGKQIGAAGFFRYARSGLNIPYEDTNGTNSLHLSLVNDSGVAKTAGVPGEVVVKVGMNPVA